MSSINSRLVCVPILFAALPGCGFQASSLAGDGGIDAPPDMAVNQTYGSFVKVKFNALQDVPTAPVEISDQTTINTDGDSRCNTSNDQVTTYCVVAGSDIKINAPVLATGSRPLIFVSVAGFELNSVLDGSSVRGAQTGAGASTACADTTNATGHGGGFGGSFVGSGGAGESIEANSGGVPAPSLTASPDTLRGGCPGGDGATEVGGAAGKGGAGGGAIGIIATSIKLNGKINVSGASGQGGTSNNGKSSGGGGGGAGGMIVLDADTVTVGTLPVWLFANGGGGGQGGTGGTDPGAGAGDDGKESLEPSIAGFGGNNTTHIGGSGGDGSVKAKKSGMPGAGAEDIGGGGGGGGAAGFIRSPSFEGGDISPAPTTP